MLARLVISSRVQSNARLSLAVRSTSWFSTAANDATTTATSQTEASHQNEASKPSTTHEEVDEVMEVPKNFIRFLIGVKGRNIAALKEKSGGARIAFPKEDSGNELEKARIMGDANQVAKMKELLKSEIEKIKAEMETRSAKGEVDSSYLEEVIVDTKYVGYLIGNKGVSLKELEGSSGTKIQFTNRDERSGERTARIRGSPEQVQAAKKLISEKIYLAAEEMRGGQKAKKQGMREPRESRAGDVKQVVEVPSEIVGFLIGKGGKSLFEMQDRTRAKLDFAREDHRDGAREVAIYGTEEQVRAACDLIGQRVKEAMKPRNASSN